MENQTTYRDPWETENEDQGSILSGLIGALLGAAVGAIPWFFVSTFTSFYVGWLGFIVGWASAFGYRKLKGRKSFGAAMLIVVTCSLLSLVLAEFGSWMYVLCTDPEWQASAARYGMSVEELAFESILMKENLDVILPNLLMGLFVGVLGIFSAAKYVRQYTDPEMAAQIAQSMQTIQAARSPVSNFQPTGLTLPGQFTVAMGKGAKIACTVCAVISGALLLTMLPLIFIVGDEGSFLVTGILVFCMLITVFSLVFVTNRRIEVNGDSVTARGGPGRVRVFQAADIASVSSAYLNGNVKLYGHDGRVLGSFGSNMKNAPLMMQWLREHNIPLRG